MNYPMYSNNQFYVQELQNMKDRIDTQLRQIQQNQAQQQIPQPITQNFQIAPSTMNNELESKYANNIDEVKNTFVMKTGLFVNRDYSKMWIKDINGSVREFDTNEIVEMDEKDKEILNLKKQIQEMKGMINYEPDDATINDKITEQKSTRVQSNKRANAK